MPVAYPTTLRGPLRASKSRSQPAAFGWQRPRRGMGYASLRGTQVPVFWDVQWRFTSDEAATFLRWFTEDLDRGLLEFTLPLRTEFGISDYACQFMPDALLDVREDGELWVYSATIMARALVVPSIEPFDPFFGQVVKLLMFDDADTPLLDSSPLGTNATASTAFLRDGSNPRFGLASMTSPTPPAAFWLNAPKPVSSDDEDWTWDCWFKWRADTTYTGFLRVTNWVIYVKNTGANRALKLSQAGFLVFTGPTALDTGDWMHLEVGWKKTGPSTSTTYFFVNGALEGTYTGAGGNSPIKLASSIIIGSPNSAGFSGMAGWIDAWRLTIGVCRHTEPFTPPQQLSEYFPEA